MHWEISCGGICVAVDEVAKLKLGLCFFGSVKCTRTKEGRAGGGLKEVF